MKHTVLVVDDEKLVRWSVGQVLSDNNCEIELASSGEEAIEKAKQIKFDLIVTDLKMDGLNGVETVREIKKILPKIKAIVITAYGTEKDAWDARNENIALWMAKPFQMKELIRYINDLLRETDVGKEKNSFPTQNTRLLCLLSLLIVFQFYCYTFTFAQDENASAPKYTAQYLYTIKDAGTQFEKLRTPSSIYFDSNDKNIYVVDLGNNRIYSYDTNGVITHEWNSFGKIKSPATVTEDREGNIYVGDISKPLIVILSYFGTVRRYLDLTKMLMQSEQTTQPSFFTNGDDKKISKTTNPPEIRIRKLLIDNQDRLYIADNKKNRVFIVDIFTGELIKEIGGQNNPEIDIKSLTDMALDDRGNLLVLDAARNQVLVISPEGYLIRSFGKTGEGDYDLGLSSGLAWDGNQKWIMVTDSNHHRVLVYNEDGDCFLGFGRLGMTNGLFYFPRGITVDSNQHIYVLEPSMNRIQVFSIIATEISLDEKKS
jgi:CheY-like chemotaxis protein/sugar lactone lactonase YvrE